MRKLANGNENTKKWSLEATCTGMGWDQLGKTPCNALFELNQGDIYQRKHTDYSGCTDTYYGFICPDCGCFTELKSSDIPSFVRNTAKNF